MFDGYCAARNVDPFALELDRFLNLVYYWWTEHMDGDDRQKFDLQLAMPPAGVVPTSGPWSDEAMGAGFMAVAAQGKVSATVK